MIIIIILFSFHDVCSTRPFHRLMNGSNELSHILSSSSLFPTSDLAISAVRSLRRTPSHLLRFQQKEHPLRDCERPIVPSLEYKSYRSRSSRMKRVSSSTSTFYPLLSLSLSLSLSSTFLEIAFLRNFMLGETPFLSASPVQFYRDSRVFQTRVFVGSALRPRG